MTHDPDLVESARLGNPDAIRAVLAHLYPAISRMALALAGRDDVARGIISFVMREAARRFAEWTDPDAPWRWFFHHTLLTARRSAKHAPSSTQEVLTHQSGSGVPPLVHSGSNVPPLVHSGSGDPPLSHRGSGVSPLVHSGSGVSPLVAVPPPAPADPAYIAFIRAIRLLPEQQREAILLWHGEKLPERPLAITMDCSTTAAAAHLRAAEASLATISGPTLPALLARLQTTYAQLTPSDDVVTPAVRHWVDQALRPRRTRRLLRRLIWLTLTAAAIWAAYHFL